MSQLYDHTWAKLEDVLTTINYTRDPVPRKRFQLVRDDISNYAVLYIFTYTPNTYSPEEMRHTRHEFVVPVATYNRSTWTRWVFDRILSIEAHETCESFKVDGVRIYAPHHGNGEDPYSFWPGGTDEQKRKAPGDE